MIEPQVGDVIQYNSGTVERITAYEGVDHFKKRNAYTDYGNGCYSPAREYRIIQRDLKPFFYPEGE